MAEHMVRTQVYLPKAAYEALIQRGQEQGVTMAVQIRAALDEYLQRSQEKDEGPILQPDDPLFAMMGIFDSGVDDLAIHHDHYLYGMPKREPTSKRAVRESHSPARKLRKPRRPRSKKLSG